MKIYIGWDAREVLAYDVCKYSLESKASIPIDVIPLKHRELRERGLFRRPWLVESDTGLWRDMIDNKPFSTEFSHTRFLVPALNNYRGWALFMDCDMISTVDIRQLFDLCDPRYAVMVVKHNQKVTDTVKMDGQKQEQYHRKNWSSFVLWNCEHPANRQLTPELVNTMTGASLHAFAWLSDHHIGHLGNEWNWIAGVSPVLYQGKRPAVIHYTEGGPWFENKKEVIYGDIWMEYYTRWQRETSGGLTIIRG